MNIRILRNAFITGVTAIALTAGTLAVPNKAQAFVDPITGAIIGGVIVGGIAATQLPTRVAVAPSATYGVVVGPNCHFERQAVFNPATGLYTYQNVKVCI
jgi:hypothetical protein